MTWCVTGNGEARRGEEFVVECKRCWRFVPAGVDEFPRENVRVDCPLCGEKRMYRPSEVYLGYANLAVRKQQVQRAEALRVALRALTARCRAPSVPLSAAKGERKEGHLGNSSTEK